MTKQSRQQRSLRFSGRIFTFVSTLLLSVSLMAADPAYYSHKSKGAIKGADVVAYYSLQPGQPAVKGRDEFTYEWQNTVWKFSSEENRQAFIANPERYAPQYGGYCAFAVGHNFTTDIRPDSWTIIDDKLYLNHNGISQRKFHKDLAKSIDRADGNWPNVR